jgi:hypothetical protein
VAADVNGDHDPDDPCAGLGTFVLWMTCCIAAVSAAGFALAFTVAPDATNMGAGGGIGTPWPVILWRLIK